MESLLQLLRERLNGKSYGVLQKLAGYIDSHYVMDALFDGVDEKIRRSGKTLLTIYLKEESIGHVIIRRA